MNISSQSPNCPCCGGASVLTRDLPRDSIEARLIEMAVFDSKSVRNCSFGNYRMFRCGTCDLEFADPMREPENDFYLELAHLTKYYPESRWEWGECIKQLQSEVLSDRMRVLDVGCGTGQFLLLLKNLEIGTGIGLDVTASSVEACRARGLDVIRGTFPQAKARIPEGVDIITLWHVLEHVSNPLALLADAKSALTTGGSIFFSVPLSPTSYETLQADPLNLPPHHLTRWSVKSILSLAKRLDMSAGLFFPEADRYLQRLTRTLLLEAIGSFSKLEPAQKVVRLAWWMLLHPRQLATAGYQQLYHPRLNGKVLPDVVLACFHNK